MKIDVVLIMVLYMKLSVCTDAVFKGKNTVESMKKIRNSGYTSFEFWSWWDKDIDSIIKAQEELGMEVVAFCTQMISLVDATQRCLYLEGLKETILVAKRFSCKTLITQTGDELVGVSREKQHESLVEGLRLCAPILEKAGITIVMEPLNTLVNHKGYYLTSSDEAFQIVKEVGSPNVKVLYDIYHQQITEGHLIARITGNIDKIGHFHAAGNPGRHELYNSEINYDYIFTTIDNTEYSGYMGLEYFPIEDAIVGLEKLKGK